MAEYVHAPIPQDPDELKAIVADYMASRIPGWEPADGNLDWWIVEAFAEVIAQIGEAATEVPRAIFRHYGAKVVGLPPQEAAPATVTTTWTVIDTDGLTIPAGAVVDLLRGDERASFATTDEVVIPAGQSSATAVLVVALEPGAAGNGYAGLGELVDPLDRVGTVAVVGSTAGGKEAEPDEDYLDRLADELRLLTPRPILADDFAVLARRVTGVDRALAIDNYDPATQTFNNERMVTVAVRDAAGEPISPGAKQAVIDLLDAEREVNFVVYVVDPSYTTFNVTYAVTAWPGVDKVALKADADAAVAAFLNPATFGAANYHGGDPRRWELETKVRYLELAQALQEVEGVRYVDSVTFAKQGQPLDKLDVTMTGAAPLPRPGTVNGTVS